MLKREDIRIRDPFIYTDRENGCYYMYGTTACKEGSLSTEPTLTVYKTEDLEHFSEGKVIFSGEEIGFWAYRDYLAPEMHKYNGKYYLFVSFKSEKRHRATQILVCDTPDGRFQPVSKEPITPPDWECLDGTLWVENGVPYMVFCHEWVQVVDGEIWAVPLKEDLSAPAGEPFFLFRASENPNVSAGKRGQRVTDGPFLFREEGKLKMIWSSFYEGRYLVLEAESDSIHGKWEHKGSRYDFDGGHAMLFETLDGTRMISLHSPNKAGLERAMFLEY